jgi:hypothetical protein
MSTHHQFPGIVRLVLGLLALLVLAACDSTPPASPTPVAPPTATGVPDTPTPTGPPPNIGVVYLDGGNLRFRGLGAQGPRTMAGPDLGDGGPVTAYAVSPNYNWIGLILAGRGNIGTPTVPTTTPDPLTGGLWLVNGQNGQRFQIAGGIYPPGGPAAARPIAQAVSSSLTFSPDSRLIAYVIANSPSGDRGTDLMIAQVALPPLDAPPPRPVRLARSADALILGPVWSPVRRYVAFLEAPQLGTGAGYDAVIKSVALLNDRPAEDPVLLIDGRTLPNERRASPPLDLTWTDGNTLAFQAFTAQSGISGTWQIGPGKRDSDPSEVAPGQAGPAAWSSPDPSGQRWLAYRLPGHGLFIVPGGGSSDLQATALVTSTAVSGSGAIPPIWAQAARYVAFSAADARVLIADRTAPGTVADTGAAGAAAVRAAWNDSAGDGARLALAGPQQLTIVDAGGQARAQIALTGLGGSPQRLVWQPLALDMNGPPRLLVQGADTGAGAPTRVYELHESDGTLVPLADFFTDPAAPPQWTRLAVGP